jgi:hypothetical protein
MLLAVRIVSEVASEMALFPLAWLGVLRSRKRAPGIAWAWLAGAFAVSWIADTAALWVDPWVVGAVYPVSQAALVGAVFLHRRDVMMFVVVLIAVGIVDVFSHGVEDPDILLRTVAWLGVMGIVWQLPQLEKLRTSLLVTFGLGWLCWMGYAAFPGWTSWGIYQTARLAGILLFCRAATDPPPHFKITTN